MDNLNFTVFLVADALLYFESTAMLALLNLMIWFFYQSTLLYLMDCNLMTPSIYGKMYLMERFLKAGRQMTIYMSTALPALCNLMTPSI